MGRDKALLSVDGVQLAVRALGELQTVFADTILVNGKDRDYSDLGYPQVRDRYADCGPLAGVEAALDWAAPRAAFVLACDLPRVDRRVVHRLLEAGDWRSESSVARARIARRGRRLQPLCGLYATPCGEVAGRLLAGGERSVHQWLAGLEVETVDFDDLDPDPFLNINTPADAARVGCRLVPT
jgi:molybdopterin-guanine dinucleotide biosynthesis protein A